jgi:hypothetical protein
VAGAGETVPPAEHPYGSQWQGKEAWAISPYFPDRSPLVVVVPVRARARDRDIAWEVIVGDTA